MVKGLRQSDIILALFVIAITAMLLVPLPTVLLDFLLVTNLSIAFLLLLIGLYLPNALALLSFPTILLLTTLFRLGLNVASTRLILSQADAGEVIRAFGTFLISGEIFVGVVIFTIITIVNFVVVARGASRVSEVAARFALDALPGKQLAIDSDLRTGLISAEEAHEKREELRKESQLYGAMDGAMKFVQGDAIAGVFIIFTNILGGIYVGLKDGKSFSDVIEVYLRLTVGDGLLHQIPAILISICAGIVVTRVASSEHTTLGSDVSAQLFSRWGALVAVGAALVAIGVLTDLPTVPFAVVGIAAISLGLWTKKHRQGVMGEAPHSFLATSVDGAPSVLADEEATDDRELVIALDSPSLFRKYDGAAAQYRVWWEELRRDFYADNGLWLPRISVVADERLAQGSYTIHLGSSIVEEGSVVPDTVLVDVNPASASVLGLEVFKEEEHPLSRAKIFWTRQTPSVRKIVDNGLVKGHDFFHYIGLRCAVFFMKHPEELLGVAEVHALLKGLEKRYPGLVTEAFPQQSLNIARLTEICQELVREGVSLKDFRQIVELVATYCSAENVSLVGEEQVDVQSIVGFVRLHRRRQLVSRLLSPRRTLKVVTLSSGIEEVLRESEVTESATGLMIDPSSVEALRAGLASLLDPVRAKGIAPVVLLCATEVRHKLALLLRNVDRSVRFLTFEELDQELTLEPVGVWRMAAGEMV